MPLRNVLIVAVSVIVSLACYSIAAKNKYANLFAEALHLVENEALREIPREKLFSSAMNGMLGELDPHSQFISGEQLQALNEEIDQEFEGIGIRIDYAPERDSILVLAPLPNTPAQQANLRPGDEIVEIDGQSVDQLKPKNAVTSLRGPVDQTVKLVIRRDGQRLTKEVGRAVVIVPSVLGDFRDSDSNWQYVLKNHPRIGYLRLTQFGKKSAEEMGQALLAISKNVDGVILDLRNNGGGLLDAAVEICDFFLPPDKLIVSTQTKTRRHATRSGNDPIISTGVPLVILINRTSASASEIVSGCLQDHRRAVIIGEQSWGKGTVQNMIPMQRGQSVLKLTTASYWRPSDKPIDRHDEIAVETKIWGVQPDPGYEVEMTELDVNMNRRLRILRHIEGPPGSESRIDELIKKISRMQLDRVPVESSPDNPDAEDNQPLAAPPELPHLDQPLLRAIEYFQQLRQQEPVAA